MSVSGHLAARGMVSAYRTGPKLSESSDVIVFVHGLVANSLAWLSVIDRVPSDVATISVDLRGRGDSAALSGPWGIRTHVADLRGLITHQAANQRVLLVGHGLGAFVVANFALSFPDLVRGALLVDGGLRSLASSLDSSVGFGKSEAERVVEAAVAGQARTIDSELHYNSRRFRSRLECCRYWQDRPTFRSMAWSDNIDRFLGHDLGGVEPSLSSRVDFNSVLQDVTEISEDLEVVSAAEDMECPTELLRAEHGMLGRTQPTISSDAAEYLTRVNPNVRVTLVPMVSHDSIILSAAGADAVAAAVRRQL